MPLTTLPEGAAVVGLADDAAVAAVGAAAAAVEAAVTGVGGAAVGAAAVATAADGAAAVGTAAVGVTATHQKVRSSAAASARTKNGLPEGLICQAAHLAA